MTALGGAAEALESPASAVGSESPRAQVAGEARLDLGVVLVATGTEDALDAGVGSAIEELERDAGMHV